MLYGWMFEVWSFTNWDKQYLFLRNNYLILMCLIVSAAFNMSLVIFSYCCQRYIYKPRFGPEGKLRDLLGRVNHLQSTTWITSSISDPFYISLSVVLGAVQVSVVTKQFESRRTVIIFCCVYHQLWDSSNWLCQSWAALLDAGTVSLNKY